MEKYSVKNWEALHCACAVHRFPEPTSINPPFQNCNPAGKEPN